MNSETIMTRRAKLLAALLLLVALVLPQSTCAGYRGPDGRFVTRVPADAPPDTYRPAVERSYAYDEFRLRQPDTWPNVLVFLWPLPLLAIAARHPAGRVRFAVWVAEPLLAVGSAYMIWLFASTLATPAVGAYLGVTAMALYLLAWLVELWSRVRARRLQAAARRS
jgi:hypothetical protein